MKKITKRIIAAVSAAVIAVSAAGISAFADNANGWVKEDGVSRRYANGSPYTGWLKFKDGSKKYCLDGYAVKGNFTIGSKTYEFDEDGVYTGEKFTPTVIGECKDKIFPSTEAITVTISTPDKSGKTYIAGNPDKMERWEKGSWVKCSDESSDYGVEDVALVVSYEKSNTGVFFPQDYTGKNFPEGYYRLTFPAWEEEQREGTWHIVHTVFQVTSGKSGWVKEDGVKRYYNQGTPYTGWLKTKDGSKKYVLDGYLVTDELQIGNYSYSFNSDGRMSGKTALSISASVYGGKVSAGSNRLTVKLEKLTDGVESFGALAMMERWEKGKWVDCFAESGGAVPTTMELYSMSKKGETLEMPFYSIERMNYKLTPGIYRIPINNVADSGFVFSQPIAILGADGTATPVQSNSEPTAEHVSTYAIFEVV